MNCIIYGTKCEYTTAWAQQSDKRKEHPDRTSGRTRARKKVKTSDDGDGNRTRSPASRSPTEGEEEALEAECCGHSVTDAADPISTIPDRVELDTEEIGNYSELLGIHAS
jgi:hypothetical protein